MSFTLREILGDKALVVIDECPTGKVPYASKAEAHAVAKRQNRKHRTAMTPRRCHFCDRYHLGHKRGSVW